MFTFKIGIKSQVLKVCPKCQKHVPNAKGCPKQAHGPRGRRGSWFAFCGVRVAVERGVCGVFCGANDNTLVLLAVFFFPSVSHECESQFHAASRTFPSPPWHRSRKSRRRRRCVSFALVLAAIWRLQQLLFDEQFSRNRRIVCTSLWSMWVFPLTLAPLNFLLIVEYDFWRQCPS